MAGAWPYSRSGVRANKHVFSPFPAGFGPGHPERAFFLAFLAVFGPTLPGADAFFPKASAFSLQEGGKSENRS